MASVEVLDADITSLEVDAIANAANTQLLHGGGVAGAISRAGGPALQAESRERAPIGLGEAVETGGGEMPCRWVIHAATMEPGGPTSAEASSAAQRLPRCGAPTSSARGRWRWWRSGRGCGGFPVEEAARIEVDEVRRHLAPGESGLERVVFAVRGAGASEAFERALAE